jgi:hypothetical protein
VPGFEENRKQVSPHPHIKMHKAQTMSRGGPG